MRFVSSIGDKAALFRMSTAFPSSGEGAIKGALNIAYSHQPWQLTAVAWVSNNAVEIIQNSKDFSWDPGTCAHFRTMTLR